MGHEVFLLCTHEDSEHWVFKHQVEKTVEKKGNKMRGNITY